MVRRIIASIRQYETHRSLIGRARSAAERVRADLNAIIVPASRRASNLDHAVTLARAADCQLVVLCSRKTAVGDVARLLAERSFSRAVVVELPGNFEHPLLRFESSGLSDSQITGMCVNPNGDLSTKRNLGLLLARMLGWGRILFMDDDIRDVAPADLQATVSLLGRYQSVGMRVTNFPDNSVVCHAHRATGGAQDVFVSGSVLAVNPLKGVGFFPKIYNEDWLFFYDDALTRQLAWSGRNATQLQYDPFGNTRRAERQEFGDVLAEGLYALLHVGKGVADADCDYWGAFVEERRRFLRNIISRSGNAAAEVRTGLRDAVDAAMMCLGQIQPEACENYIQAWRQDLRGWRKNLADLPRATSVDAALAELGLRRSGGWDPKSLPAPISTRPVRQAVAGPVLIPQIATALFLQSRSTIGPARGWRRRGRLPLSASLTAEAGAAEPNRAEPGAGEHVWTEATSET